ncbi:hypothetical protein F9C07_2101901 [Aspergillus flavus]|uniref:Uncharacterized protein n=2 Tax=Aspergillus flavus TaxID=5059 RepID=A0A7U2MQM5_ASPFN|nr:uncharacterized protein G4B84_001174 [Aspergillus flavus NRRL3357]KAB8245342.1 hypothetical protein BDV35DRAFT_393952 [Aspergillus flavus]QMW25929.1 hypothetical protein G4B84_001174 [Aspergillus flavus NRRL3357]QRD88035.1 hypothetical protein F9C07_2101901 [Aspergillus flavus]
MADAQNFSASGLVTLLYEAKHIDMSKITTVVKNVKLNDLSKRQEEWSHDGARSQSSGWRPFYLRRRILLIFVIAFFGIIAALEVLNHISQVNYGIASAVEGRHYMWTYGPTAILTVIAAFWSRVAPETPTSPLYTNSFFVSSTICP